MAECGESKNNNRTTIETSPDSGCLQDPLSISWIEILVGKNRGGENATLYCSLRNTREGSP
jgi:hypothetical protein